MGQSPQPAVVPEVFHPLKQLQTGMSLLYLSYCIGQTFLPKPPVNYAPPPFPPLSLDSKYNLCLFIIFFLHMPGGKSRHVHVGGGELTAADVGRFRSILLFYIDFCQKQKVSLCLLVVSWVSQWSCLLSCLLTCNDLITDWKELTMWLYLYFVTSFM